MKLHLPKQLFTALLAALTLATPAEADIYTITGLRTDSDGSISQDAAHAKYTQTTSTTDEATGAVTYTLTNTSVGPNNWDSAKSIVSGSHVIRFIATEDIANKALIYTFDSWEVAGLIVEADGYSIAGGGSSLGSRPFDMNVGTYIINGNFGIDTKNTNLNFSGTQTWTIGTNKTLNLSTTKTIKIGGGYDAADSTATAEVSISGGGTVQFNANTEITSGSSLTVDSGVTLSLGSTLTNSGTLTVSDGATLTLAATMDNAGTATFEDGAKLQIASLDGFSAVYSIGSEKSGLTTIDKKYTIYTGNAINGLNSFTLVGETQAKTLNSDGTYEGTVDAYVIAKDITASLSSTDGLTDAPLVAIAQGGTLNIDSELPTGWTAAGLLGEKVVGDGTLLISQSGLDTGNADLTTIFAGTLELADGVTFTLGATTAGSSGDSKLINTSTLTAVKLNNGSILQYHGSGATTLTNLTVNKFSDENIGKATLHYVDSNKANSVNLTGVTQLNGNLDITTTFDGGFRMSQLSGAGALNVTGGQGTFNATILSLQGYTGSLSFSDSELVATVSTGTGEAVDMGSITATGVSSFTFNVQTNTTVGTLSLTGSTTDAISVAAGKTLTVSTALSGLSGSLTLGEGSVLDLTGLNVNSVFGDVTQAASGNGKVKYAGADFNATDENTYRVSWRGTEALNFGTDVEVAKSIALNTWGSDTNKDIYSSRALTVGGVLRLESGARLSVSAGSVSAGSISLGHTTQGNPGHIELTGGIITTGSITMANINDTDNTLTMNGGVLEITSASGIASGIQSTITGGTLKASGDVSWGITGASIGGAIIVTGTGSINLAGGTLTNKLNNSDGNLALSGEFNVVSSGYTDKTATLNAASNGYASTSTVYTLVSDASNLSGADTVTWKVDGAAVAGNDTLSYADGALTHVSEGTEYYVVDTDIVYSSISKTNDKGEAITALVLNGKGVNLNEALGEGVKIKVQKEGESIVAIDNGFTLNANQVESTSTQKLKLHGSGTYTLDSGVYILGDGVVLGATSNGWTGTVKVTGASALTSFAPTNLVNGTDSWLELSGTLGYWTRAGAAAGSQTYAVNLVLTNSAVTKNSITYYVAYGQNNGWSDDERTISGSVKGDGNWGRIDKTGTGQTWTFAGDVSGWTGKIFNGADDQTTNYCFTGNGANGSPMVLDVEIRNSNITANGEYSNTSCSGTLNLTLQNTNGFTVNKGIEATNLTLNSAGGVSLNADVSVSKMQVNNTATLTGESNSITAGKVTISQKNASLSNVTVQGSSIAATATDGTKGSISNANVALAQLQADATFTIENMTLTNTTITAATAETMVNLQNVEGSTALLVQGAFTLNATPTVGVASSGETRGTLSYTNGLAIAMDNNATLTLNLDVLNAVGAEQHGVYDITITLSGFGDNFAVTEEILNMVCFDSTSWLGQALASQNAEYSVVMEQTPVTAAEGGVPTVSYAAGTGGNVGSLVITIAGLNVPEPATSTLSLLALAALAARRRRK